MLASLPAALIADRLSKRTVIVGMKFLEIGLMTLHAPDTLVRVRAAFPGRDDPGILFGMTLHTLFRVGGDGDVGSPEAYLLRLACRLHPLDQD